MEKLILNFEVTGCPNKCRHCYCSELKSNRELIDIEEVISISKQFRDYLDIDIDVYLLQEQTFHPSFIDMIKRLEEEGFTNRNGKGILISNGIGIAHNSELAKSLSEFFSRVKFTLFGTEENHDSFVNRKGHFDEIIKASKLCKEYGVTVIWQIMLTRGNANDVEKLVEYASTEGVINFVTADFYYSGEVLKDDSFVPIEDDLLATNFEVYEKENSLFIPEYQALSSIDDLKKQEISKAAIDNLYIDSNFDIYPLSNINADFKLGNVKSDIDSVLEMLKDQNGLPPLVKRRMEYDLEELVINNIDVNSKEMHTAQTLFEKLVNIEMNK